MSAIMNTTSQTNEEFETVQLNDTPIRMLVDTGASCSVISTKIASQINAEVTPSNLRLETYDEHVMQSAGFANVMMKRPNEETKCVCVKVIKCNRLYGLIGRDVLNTNVYSCSVVTIDKLPIIKGVKASVKTLPGATDKFCAARPVPLALQDKVNDTLDELVAKGVIVACPAGGLSNASPVVWVKKSNGKLRMCADYKVHVNEKICSEAYPLPQIESLFSRVSGARFFAKVDLSDAYWQIELDEEAQKLCAINTSKGLYMVKRLQMGMKNSAAIFQSCMENVVLKGLQNIIVYQDDILVYGTTEANLEKCLRALVGRLKEKNLKINESKCVQKCQKINFLGRTITPEGILPDITLVEKIQALPAPSNKRELQHVLGLIGYFGRFINQYADKVQHMQEMLRSNKFTWNEICQAELNSLKHELTKQPVLKPFSVGQPIDLYTDASQYAIAAVLMQGEHPVLYISKTLSDSESKWSNIEREAYAIVWSVTRLKQFLLGAKFTLQTDHKPLTFLFSPKVPLPKNVSARIGRWAIQLMAYDFEIKHLPGSQMAHADALSRLPQTDGEVVFNVDQPDIPYVKLPIIEKVIQSVKLNQHAQRVIRMVQSGDWSKRCRVDMPFYNAREALTIENNLLYNGLRLFVPHDLRCLVLDISHDTHMGVQQQYKKLASDYWWPNMHNDVDRFVHRCGTCAKSRAVKPTSTANWPTSGAWERLHLDWADVPTKGNVLIIVDAGTNYIDAIPCSNRTSVMVQKCLARLFGLFGLPRTVVADNAKEFLKLRLWLEKMGVNVLYSPTYHPQSNGQAERAVGTIKKALRLWNSECGDWYLYLQKILLNHRSSTGAINNSPGELLLQRKMRTSCNPMFTPFSSIWYKHRGMKDAKKVTLLTQAGSNTAIVTDEMRSWMASFDQLAPAHDEEVELQTGINWRSSREKRPPERYGLEGGACG
jgi:hypothetical protein